MMHISNKQLAKFQEHKFQSFIKACIRKGAPKNISKEQLQQLVAWQLEKRREKWEMQYNASKLSKRLSKKLAKKGA